LWFYQLLKTSGSWINVKNYLGTQVCGSQVCVPSIFFSIVLAQLKK